MIIYKITNKINGKCYIGQTTKSVERRFYFHSKSKYKSKLKVAIDKYGKDNFTIEIIEICKSLSELDEREIYWISHFNSIEDGYNIQTGGYIRDSMRGRKHTEETKRKMSEKASKENNSQYGLRGELSPNFKRKQSEIHRKNNGKAHAKPVLCINTNEIFESGKAAALHFNLNAANLNKVVKGIYKQTGGYSFKYLEEPNG